jgi:carboxypeptidase Q
MIRRRFYLLGAIALVAALGGLQLGAAGEKINYDDINKIKAEGMQRSQVMDTMSYLTDVYGPRLTGSPNIEKAGQWAVSRMKEWGLTNVSMEPWANRRGFDRGWSNDKFYVAAVAPQSFPIVGTPTAWTPGTNGLVRGEAVVFTASNEEELAAYKGTLKGKWVLMGAAPDVAAWWTAPAHRYTAEELDAMELATPPAPEFGLTPPGGRGGRGGPGAPAAAGRGGQPNTFPQVRSDFIKAEGALGVFSTAPRGHGVYTIGGARANTDPATILPQITITAEHYGRIARMIARNVPVTIEADIKNTYYDNPPMFNVVGEIAGTDKADEIVMLGGHFDSWHAATGATDNGAGAGAMMEAMRILKASGVKLRRTVRIGLWPGEEQGLNGSAEYVAMHYGVCPPPPPPPPGTAPNAGRGGGGFGRGCPVALQLKPEHAKFAGYFNIDNGTGALRGVYLQQNDAAAPIFREWMEPFRSMGMTTLTVRNTGGTDHLSFDAVGLPGWQFIQDPVEYDTMTHHTNLDSYERLQPNDMMKNSVIAASFAYLAANRDDKMPRKPMPVPDAGGRGRSGQ